MRLGRKSWIVLGAAGVLGLLSIVFGPRVIQSVTLHDSPEEAHLEMGDVRRFLSMLDSLGTAGSTTDSTRIITDRYFAPGSPGLDSFIRARIGNADGLLAQIRSHPRYYAHLTQSLADIAGTERGIRTSFTRFKTLYPEARFSDVYLVIGRMNSGGTTSPGRILIGAEMYGLNAEAPRDELNDWERTVLRDQALIPTIVTHELMHLLQRHSWRSNVLRQALREGGADFVAELVTGKNINAHVHEWAQSRERAIWEEFRQAMSGKEYGRWFGQGSPDRPADIGYWVGYRIVQAYYEAAPEKTQAIEDILQLNDPEEFLVRSGYKG
jgi:hypothetical protein